ncbi:MAG TPA: hypothetical protein VHB77_03365, partial [Planctomycetaceae bacterium]|nr:hypothetical protein [Planctomycetaceae bacterium]
MNDFPIEVPSPARCLNRRALLRQALGGLASAPLIGALMVTENSAEAAPRGEAQDGPMDGDRAFGYLVDVCRIGPRPSGSPGMAAQQKLIVEYFAKTRVKVQFQPFDARHPLTGDPVRMNNIIVSWNPQATERVLLAAH